MATMKTCYRKGRILTKYTWNMSGRKYHLKNRMKSLFKVKHIDLGKYLIKWIPYSETPQIKMKSSIELDEKGEFRVETNWKLNQQNSITISLGVFTVSLQSSSLLAEVGQDRSQAGDSADTKVQVSFPSSCCPGAYMVKERWEIPRNEDVSPTFLLPRELCPSTVASPDVPYPTPPTFYSSFSHPSLMSLL